VIQKKEDSETETINEQNIVSVFKEVDSKIDPNETDVGTTAVVSFLIQTKQGIEIICANTGDSRCIFYNDGKIKELSKDQKPNNEEEKKRIVESGNIVLLGRVNGSLAVARAFGDFRYKKSKDKNLLPEETAVTVIPEIKKRNFYKGR